MIPRAAAISTGAERPETSGGSEVGTEARVNLVAGTHGTTAEITPYWGRSRWFINQELERRSKATMKSRVGEWMVLGGQAQPGDNGNGIDCRSRRARRINNLLHVSCPVASGDITEYRVCLRP